jgi:hypothetical protein
MNALLGLENGGPSNKIRKMFCEKKKKNTLFHKIRRFFHYF